MTRNVSIAANERIYPAREVHLRSATDGPQAGSAPAARQGMASSHHTDLPVGVRLVPQRRANRLTR
jgi:hypothetical protein